MKKACFLAVLTVLTTVSLGAQDQPGSVAIAEHISSVSNTALPNFTKCVTDLKSSGTKDGDARKSCAEMVKVSAKTSTEVAKHSAKATKASRPVVVGGYSYRSYGGSYYGGSYRYRVPRYRVPRYRR